jgi:hypothetical protein
MLPQADDIQDMEFAPHNRPIFLLESFEDQGTLSYWRTTRVRIKGKAGWEMVCYWASSLTKRKLEFEPVGWRESVFGAALEAAQANDSVA